MAAAVSGNRPRVLVAGATGRTGREIVDLLAPRAVTLRCLTRSAEKRSDLRARGADEVVVGDLLEDGDAERAAEDVDVVLSAVGSTLRDRFTADEFVDGSGNRNLVAAAVDAGADAFVMVSALGVGPEPSSLLGTGFDLVIPPIQRAKAAAEMALRGAPLRHTIFRPGALTRVAPSGEVQVASPGEKLWGPVRRADVACLVAAAPWTPAADDETFEVVRNPLVADRARTIDWQLPVEAE